MEELTLDDLAIQDTKLQPEDSIKLNPDFIKKVNILCNNVKDFMATPHKLLFIEGKANTSELHFYFSNALLTVQWIEYLDNKLTSDVDFATDIRFLAKILGYAKNIVLCDIYSEPSLWLFNNKVKLLNTSLSRKTAKLEDIEIDKAVKALPEISEISDIVKKYHLEKGCLFYDKEHNVYHKDFNLNTIGLFKSDVKLALPFISLEILKIVNIFADSTLFSNDNFTVISWKSGCLKAPSISSEMNAIPELKEIKSLKIDIDVVKQLLKIIKLMYNNIQITLLLENKKMYLIGYIDGKEAVEYSLDIESDTDFEITEVHLVLDSFLDVIKEFSGIIDVDVDTQDNIFVFTDGTYSLLVQRN